MPQIELREPDFSKWLGIQMTPSPNDPDVFSSDSQGGLSLTEVATLETHRGKGKKVKTFWSATIRVNGYEATGNDFDRAAARDESWEKLKELVWPLIHNFERLGFLPPN